MTVHAERIRSHGTGTCVVLVDESGERTMLPDPGANDAPAVVPETALQRGDHLHVIGYALVRDGARPGALAAIERARAAGMTVSVDPSSWALVAAGRLSRRRPADAERGRGARARADAGREVVTKLGAARRALDRRGDNGRVPAEPVQVVDTTGAGDAFAAGLLSARLEGAGPREALEAGCRVAARAVARVGARPGYD